jgi:hypothetical protein
MPTRLHLAIRMCLNLCRNSPQPLAEVDEFADLLRREPGWTIDEVHAFRARVLRLIRRMRTDRRDRAA